MIETMVWLVLGALLIVVALLAVFRSSDTTKVVPAKAYSSPVPGALSESGAQDQVNRIFGCEDWEFVRDHASTEAQRAFLKDRKELALRWLRSVRNCGKAAMHHHVSCARNLGTLEPLWEVRLAMRYVLFMVSCELFGVMIAIAGPVALGGMVRRAYGISERLHGFSELSAEKTLSRERVGSH